MVAQEADAKKEALSGDAVWQTVAGARKLVVASGKKVIEFDPASADRGELLKKIRGRTGNLRAPTLKVGDVFYIGFNEEMYSNLG